MRSYCSLYVDAGYLLASAATFMTGTSLRKGVRVDYASLIDALVEQAEALSDLPVLRVHWYDAAKDGVPDGQQERIGELPRVKLRLGRFGVDGQQKGVDLRIGLDLVAHARNRTAEVFLLVSGDDDLTEAVEEAQVHGVQVTLLAVPNAAGSPHGVSRHLLRAADALTTLEPATLHTTITKVEVPALSPATTAPAGSDPAIPTPNDLMRPRPSAAPSSPSNWFSLEPTDLEDRIDAIVRNVIDAFSGSASPEQWTELLQGRPSIPPDIDRALLIDLSASLGIYDLPDSVRFRLRDRFWTLASEQS